MEQKNEKQQLTAWQGVAVVILILVILYFVYTAIVGSIDASHMSN